MAEKSMFWVVSRQPKEVNRFGKMRVPASFKTIEEAKPYCRELNLRRGAYHPGYIIEERIGDRVVSASKKVTSDEESDE